MREDDARKLDRATLKAMRIRAVRSVQAGKARRGRTVLEGQPAYDIRMVGAVSARWMGSAEGDPRSLTAPSSGRAGSDPT